MSIKKQLILCSIAMNYGGNEDAKKQFHTAMRKISRNIVQRLLTEGYLKSSDEYKIYSNFGGPAVLGETVIHSEWFQVYFGERMILFRTCDGLNDYEGGQNRWINYKFIVDQLTKYDKKTDDGYGSIEDIVRDRLFALSLLRN